MKKILDYFTWGFLFLFAIPSVIIVASWQSLPGDTMYPVKLSLEGTLLFFVKPSYAASSALNIKYTERRFAETKRLLSDKQSVEGLPYLKKQVVATKAVIDQAPSQKEKKELAQTYVATLKEVAKELEQQKQEISVQPQPKSVAVTEVSTPTPTPVPEKRDAPVKIEEEITGTQEAIGETIEELEKIMESEEEESEEVRSKKGQGKDQEKEKKDNHGKDKKNDD